ncbi:TraR/DksA family transcriptional regulator [Geoalkalibacter halelectricus]|uniref:TraR/DksA family transcriptional regulator n=1 Tax=Geoalkalibacter halelectricus TaxID=2847045 RepID=A0ABY5ZN77_9BACT|nr:TraR/DksA family transcriptional regulator [Geoalkalibacter halelectricus]MDO3378594.1 TraR/DksA family transcriptional regulator [Geoalkalibacter halelectricus]UWZ80093.1 TraR/DksA family transcriptional regulator [Geoalkalibacter halelectricus]
MDPERVEQARRQLLKLRQEALREVNDSLQACQDLGQDGVGDIGDISANTYNRDVLMNLSETQRQLIRDIDAALERIAQGEYGECLRCGEEIAPRRMEVRPFSRYCVECKTEVEKFGE